jgi:hypothetical protein
MNQCGLQYTSAYIREQEGVQDLPRNRAGGCGGGPKMSTYVSKCKNDKTKERKKYMIDGLHICIRNRIRKFLAIA